MNPHRVAGVRGFTLIEVLVALVIVALGMGALLETLTASAGNVAALRDKTAAEWIAMNQIANTRLALTAPAIGTTSGDVRNCANGNWHWQQQVAAISAVPGLLSVTVSVRRTGATSAETSGSSDSSTSSGATAAGLGAASLGATGALGSGSALVGSGCISTTGPGSSLGSGNSIGPTDSIGPSGDIGPSAAIGPGAAALGTVSLSSTNPAVGAAAAGSSGTATIRSLFAAGSDNGQSWLITLTGFRGNSLAAASGESPDWAGSTFAGEGGTQGIPNAGGGVVRGNSPPLPR